MKLKDHYSIKQFVYPSALTYNYLFKYDVSQLEICVLAALSEDRVLIEELINGVDIHSRNFSEFYSVPLRSVTPEDRRFAKTRSFELQYGATAKGMARNAGVPVSVCQKFIDEYYKKYSQVAEFFARKTEEVYTNAENKGEYTFLKDGETPGKVGFYYSPLGRKFCFTPYPSDWRKPQMIDGEVRFLTYSFSKPQIQNYICQGTGYDVVQILRNNFFHLIRRNSLEIMLSNEIHDEEIGTRSKEVSPENLVGTIHKALAHTKANLVNKYEWEIWSTIPLRVEGLYLEEPNKSWKYLLENGTTFECGV